MERVPWPVSPVLEDEHDDDDDDEFRLNFFPANNRMCDPCEILILSELSCILGEWISGLPRAKGKLLKFAMDEGHEILLNSIRGSGISIPLNLSSLEDLTPDSLVSICAQFLLLIDDSSPSFPTSLPSSMADRFKICDAMACAIKALGYGETLGFHQFLYPYAEGSYKLMRFMMVKLSEVSEGRIGADNYANKSLLVQKEATCDSGKVTSNQESKTDDVAWESQSNQIAGKLGDPADAYEKDDYSSVEAERGHSEESRNNKKLLCFNEENVKAENMSVAEPQEKLASLLAQLSELRDGVDKLQHDEEMLIEAKHVKTLQVQRLEHDYDILKAAVDMAFDDQHSAEYFFQQLNEQVESRRRNITELELQWNSLKQTPEVRTETLGLSSHNLESGVLKKLYQLKEIEQETEETISEINRREFEHSSLLEELQKMPKIPPRKTFIQRISEITKNSWKQDADVDRILRETRELQLESNSIRERLDRTYVVVDETVFREAKKDAMGRQVYGHLTSIHESFEQISDKILATDRARRERDEQERKRAALFTRSIDIDKLQADLDSIRKENELLELQLQRD